MKIDKSYQKKYDTAIYGYEPNAKNDCKRIMSIFISVIRLVEVMMRGRR